MDQQQGNGWNDGYVHVYTGNGKGKTTAALGVALRAAGAGLKVYIAQFIKGLHYSELESLQQLSKHVTIRQFGRGCFIRREPVAADVDAARHGLDEIRHVLREGAHRVVILDEANVAITCGLFPVEDLNQLIDEKPPHVELILTGRGARPEILERADLVTEMREVKHYYQRGVLARAGIDK